MFQTDAKRLLVLYSSSCCLSSLPTLSAIILLLCTDSCHAASKFSPNINGITSVISQEKGNWKREMINVFFLRMQASEWSICTCERETSKKKVLSSVTVVDFTPPLTQKQWTSPHSILKHFCLFVQNVFNIRHFKNSSRALLMTLQTTWDDSCVFMFLHFFLSFSIESRIHPSGSSHF